MTIKAQQQLKIKIVGEMLTTVINKKTYKTLDPKKRDKIKKLIEGYNKRNSEAKLEAIIEAFDETKIKKKIEKKVIKHKIKETSEELIKLKKGTTVTKDDGGKVTKQLKLSLESDKRFFIENDQVYLLPNKTVAMPQKLVDKIKLFIETGKDLNPLINFWKWCLLNPNPIARHKLFDYLERHNLIVTPNGNFVTYRMVKTHVNNKKLPDGEFTDAHTGTFRYKIGEVASMKRSDCDEDGSKDCSRGLHTGSPDFIGIKLGDGYNKGTIKTKSQGGGYGTGYDHPTEQQFDDTFGNQAVICLVNPMHVVSIPNSDTRKMRSCELYFAKTTTPEEVLNHLTDKDYTVFDHDYTVIQLAELDKLIKETNVVTYSDKIKRLKSTEKIEEATKQLNELKSRLALNGDKINQELPIQDIIGIIKSRIKEI